MTNSVIAFGWNDWPKDNPIVSKISLDIISRRATHARNAIDAILTSGKLFMLTW